MNLEYPNGFPPDCRDLVEVEKIRADKDFRLTEQAQTLEQRALRWICRMLGAFAKQACELVKAKHWTFTRVGAAVNEFRLELVRKADYTLSDGRLGWVDRIFGTSIHPEVREAIETSAEWQHYCDELLELAERSAPIYSSRHGANYAASGSRPELPAVAGEPTRELADEGTSRELRLEQFRADRSVTYADIQHSAAVHKADFQKWRSGKMKADSVMSQRIEDVLNGTRPFMRKLPKRRVE